MERYRQACIDANLHLKDNELMDNFDNLFIKAESGSPIYEQVHARNREKKRELKGPTDYRPASSCVSCLSICKLISETVPTRNGELSLSFTKHKSTSAEAVSYYRNHKRG